MTQEYRLFPRAGHAPALAFVAALIAQLVPLAAIAATASAGSGNSSQGNGGNGFGCASGTSYQMINGIARCALPNATGTPGASCEATVLMQGACSFSFPSATSGSTPAIPTGSVGYSGFGQATCSHGTWSALTATCSANACNGLFTDFGACAFAIPAIASGQSIVVPTSTATYTGSMTASCTAGSLTVGAQTCAPNPTPSCPAAPAASQTLTCQDLGMSAWWEGTVIQTRTLACNAGTGWTWSVGPWATTSSTCDPAPPPTGPSNTQIVGGNRKSLGCDDQVSFTSTGTYTGTSTWIRSPDGRGPDLQSFLSKRIQKWSYDGRQWNPLWPVTDVTVNYGMNPANRCQ